LAWSSGAPLIYPFIAAQFIPATSRLSRRHEVWKNIVEFAGILLRLVMEAVETVRSNHQERRESKKIQSVSYSIRSWVWERNHTLTP
jgi:hypothetical protein